MGSSGYIKYSSGLKIQWGRTGLIGDNKDSNISFTVGFIQTPRVVTSSEYGPDDGTWNSAYYIKRNTIKTSGCTIHSRGAKDGGRYVNWLAIGY